MSAFESAWSLLKYSCRYCDMLPHERLHAYWMDGEDDLCRECRERALEHPPPDATPY